MNKKQLGEIISRAESLCDQRGVRFTSLRKRVFTLLCTSDKPLSAYEILDLLRASTTNPAPPTVYRALDFTLPGLMSEKSITLGGAPIKIPDFRSGEWD